MNFQNIRAMTSVLWMWFPTIIGAPFPFAIAQSIDSHLPNTRLYRVRYQISRSTIFTPPTRVCA